MLGDLTSLLVILAIATTVPFLLGLTRVRIAEVVLFLALGAIAGPSVLGWIVVDEPIALLSELGLGALFFLAGYELDRASVTGRDGRLAAMGWLGSVAVAFVLVETLERIGAVQDPIGVEIALTTTALGTLLPILRAQGDLDTRFGRLFMGAGAWGELGPIVAIAVLLGTRSMVAAIAALVLFALVVAALATLPSRLHVGGIARTLHLGSRSGQHLSLRLTLLLLVGLLALADVFGFDIVLGAFVAGMIVRRLVPHDDDAVLLPKMEAIGFGFLIPVFFVVSGAKLDLASIAEQPATLLVFTAMLLVARGVPQFLVYRRALPEPRERARLSLYVATALPLLVAITTIQVDNGLMLPSNAAAIVGAGALSVLLFPLLAQLLARAQGRQRERASNAA